MKSTLIIVASALTLAILAAPAFAGQGRGNGHYGSQQPTSSANAEASQKTRAEVKAELKAWRDSGQPNKEVYRGN